MQKSFADWTKYVKSKIKYEEVKISDKYLKIT